MHGQKNIKKCRKVWNAAVMACGQSSTGTSSSLSTSVFLPSVPLYQCSIFICLWATLHNLSGWQWS